MGNGHFYYYRYRAFFLFLSILIFLSYNNCGRPGFSLDSNLNLSSESLQNGAGGSINSTNSRQYIKACVQRSMSKMENLSEIKSDQTKPKFSSFIFKGKKKNTTNEKSNLNQKSSFHNEEYFIPSGTDIAIQVDNECVKKRGPISILSQLLIKQKRILMNEIKVAVYSVKIEQDLFESQFKSEIEKDVCIHFAEENIQLSLHSAGPSPNDPRYPDQIHMNPIQHNENYPLFFNSENGINQTVKLAIIDSGIDSDHPDLADNILKDSNGNIVGKNTTYNTSVVRDSGFHGTHVSGLAAAISNNGRAGSGVMGSNIKIIPVRAIQNGQTGSLSDIATGVRWAADQGADVINMSVGGVVSDTTVIQTLRSAIEYAINKGSFIVVAAGNDGQVLSSTYQVIPANFSTEFEGLLTVGSVDSVTGVISSFSNRSSTYVKIMAPGSNGTNGILSTAPTWLTTTTDSLASKMNKMNSSGQYVLSPIHGTSMASPVVAGAAALTIALARSRGYHPTPDQIEKIIIKGSLSQSNLLTYAKDGKKLNLSSLIQAIDEDTGVNSSSSDSRNFSHGIIQISSQPNGTEKVYGSQIQLSVGLSSNSSVLLDFQWYKNGYPIVGENKRTLTIPSVSETDAGEYYLQIKAGSNIVTSQKAAVYLAPSYCL